MKMNVTNNGKEFEDVFGNSVELDPENGMDGNWLLDTQVSMYGRTNYEWKQSCVD